jgi:hypothetical protein
MNGDKLRSDGTTKNDIVAWRGHDTVNWGSAGCITGKTNNTGGSIVTAASTLMEWEVTYGEAISGNLILNYKTHGGPTQ